MTIKYIDKKDDFFKKEKPSAGGHGSHKEQWVRNFLPEQNEGLTKETSPSPSLDQCAMCFPFAMG